MYKFVYTAIYVRQHRVVVIDGMQSMHFWACIDSVSPCTMHSTPPCTIHSTPSCTIHSTEPCTIHSTPPRTIYSMPPCTHDTQHATICSAVVRLQCTCASEIHLTGHPRLGLYRGWCSSAPARSPRRIMQFTPGAVSSEVDAVHPRRGLHGEWCSSAPARSPRMVMQSF